MERSPYTQEDVEFDVLEVLRGGRVMSTQEVIQAVKRRLNLSAADRQRANVREQESKVDTIIANALQDRRRLCRDGLIERVERGVFRITAAGREDIANREANVAATQPLLDKILGDTDLD